MSTHVDTIFWWLGAGTAAVLASALAVFIAILARYVFFTAIFVKRAIEASGWRDGVPWWRKPICFVEITWQWLRDPPTAVTAHNGQRVRHPLSTLDDAN